MGGKIFVSRTFYVRNKYLRTNPKLSLAFWMVRLRVLIFFSDVFFTLIIIIITYTLSQQIHYERGQFFVVPALLSCNHGASSPLSKIRLKKKSTGGIMENMVSADSLGQCASYQTIGTIKAQCNSIKYSPFVFVRGKVMQIEQ